MKPPKAWIQLLLVPALFYVGVKLSLAFAVLPEVVVMLWIPNSLLVATLFHYGLRRYPIFVSAIIVAEVAADYPTFSLIESSSFGAVNIAEATFVYALLRRWRFNPSFSAPLDLVKFVLAGPMIGAFAAAAAAAGVYSYFRGVDTGYFEFLRIWWFSDGSGLLILTPLVLSLWPPARGNAYEQTTLQWYDAVAIGGGILVIIGFLLSDQGIFHNIPVRSSLLLPIVLYAAGRFSLRAASATLAGITFVVLYSVTNDRHPFGPLPLHQTILSAQEFIFTMSVMALGLAALLAQLRATTRELEVRVRDRTAELSAANARLRQLAVTDSLTGLPNRRALFDLLRREMSRERRGGRPLAVIMFDIDHFKEVNDHHGHAAGDAVLQHVVSTTAKVARTMDTMARYGGEEFVLILPETDAARAAQLAERMLEALRSSEVQVDEHALHVTASFGVAALRADDHEPEQLLRRADAALYAAKAAGRNQVTAGSN